MLLGALNLDLDADDDFPKFTRKRGKALCATRRGFRASNIELKGENPPKKAVLLEVDFKFWDKHFPKGRNASVTSLAAHFAFPGARCSPMIRGVIGSPKYSTDAYKVHAFSFVVPPCTVSLEDVLVHGPAGTSVDLRHAHITAVMYAVYCAAVALSQAEEWCGAHGELAAAMIDLSGPVPQLDCHVAGVPVDSPPPAGADGKGDPSVTAQTRDAMALGLLLCRALAPPSTGPGSISEALSFALQSTVHPIGRTAASLLALCGTRPQSAAVVAGQLGAALALGTYSGANDAALAALLVAERRVGAGRTESSRYIATVRRLVEAVSSATPLRLPKAELEALTVAPGTSLPWPTTLERVVPTHARCLRLRKLPPHTLASLPDPPLTVAPEGETVPPGTAQLMSVLRGGARGGMAAAVRPSLAAPTSLVGYTRPGLAVPDGASASAWHPTEARVPSGLAHTPRDLAALTHALNCRGLSVPRLALLPPTAVAETLCRLGLRRSAARAVAAAAIGPRTGLWSGVAPPHSVDAHALPLSRVFAGASSEGPRRSGFPGVAEGPRSPAHSAARPLGAGTGEATSDRSAAPVGTAQTGVGSADGDVRTDDAALWSAARRLVGDGSLGISESPAGIATAFSSVTRLYEGARLDHPGAIALFDTALGAALPGLSEGTRWSPWAAAAAAVGDPHSTALPAALDAWDVAWASCFGPERHGPHAVRGEVAAALMPPSAEFRVATPRGGDAKNAWWAGAGHRGRAQAHLRPAPRCLEAVVVDALLGSARFSVGHPVPPRPTRPPPPPEGAWQSRRVWWAPRTDIARADAVWRHGPEVAAATLDTESTTVPPRASRGVAAAKAAQAAVDALADEGAEALSAAVLSGRVSPRALALVSDPSVFIVVALPLAQSPLLRGPRGAPALRRLRAIGARVARRCILHWAQVGAVGFAPRVNQQLRPTIPACSGHQITQAPTLSNDTPRPPTPSTTENKSAGTSSSDSSATCSNEYGSASGLPSPPPSLLPDSVARQLGLTDSDGACPPTHTDADTPRAELVRAGVGCACGCADAAASGVQAAAIAGATAWRKRQKDVKLMCSLVSRLRESAKANENASSNSDEAASTEDDGNKDARWQLLSMMMLAPFATGMPFERFTGDERVRIGGRGLRVVVPRLWRGPATTLHRAFRRPLDKEFDHEPVAPAGEGSVLGLHPSLVGSGAVPPLPTPSGIREWRRSSGAILGRESAPSSVPVPLNDAFMSKEVQRMWGSNPAPADRVAHVIAPALTPSAQDRAVRSPGDSSGEPSQAAQLESQCPGLAAEARFRCGEGGSRVRNRAPLGPDWAPAANGEPIIGAETARSARRCVRLAARGQFCALLAHLLGPRAGDEAARRRTRTRVSAGAPSCSRQVSAASTAAHRSRSHPSNDSSTAPGSSGTTVPDHLINHSFDMSRWSGRTWRLFAPGHAPGETASALVSGHQQDAATAGSPIESGLIVFSEARIASVLAAARLSGDCSGHDPLSDVSHVETRLAALGPHVASLAAEGALRAARAVQAWPSWGTLIVSNAPGPQPDAASDEPRKASRVGTDPAATPSSRRTGLAESTSRRRGSGAGLIGMPADTWEDAAEYLSSRIPSAAAEIERRVAARREAGNVGAGAGTRSSSAESGSRQLASTKIDGVLAAAAILETGVEGLGEVRPYFHRAACIPPTVALPTSAAFRLFVPPRADARWGRFVGGGDLATDGETGKQAGLASVQSIDPRLVGEEALLYGRCADAVWLHSLGGGDWIRVRDAPESSGEWEAETQSPVAGREGDILRALELLREEGNAVEASGSCHGMGPHVEVGSAIAATELLLAAVQWSESWRRELFDAGLDTHLGKVILGALNRYWIDPTPASKLPMSRVGMKPAQASLQEALVTAQRQAEAARAACARARAAASDAVAVAAAREVEGHESTGAAGGEGDAKRAGDRVGQTSPEDGSTSGNVSEPSADARAGASGSAGPRGGGGGRARSALEESAERVVAAEALVRRLQSESADLEANQRVLELGKQDLWSPCGAWDEVDTKSRGSSMELAPGLGTPVDAAVLSKRASRRLRQYTEIESPEMYSLDEHISPTEAVREAVRPNPRCRLLLRLRVELLAALLQRDPANLATRLDPVRKEALVRRLTSDVIGSLLRSPASRIDAPLAAAIARLLLSLSGDNLGTAAASSVCSFLRDALNAPGPASPAACAAAARHVEPGAPHAAEAMGALASSLARATFAAGKISDEPDALADDDPATYLGAACGGRVDARDAPWSEVHEAAALRAEAEDTRAPSGSAAAPWRAQPVAGAGDAGGGRSRSRVRHRGRLRERLRDRVLGVPSEETADVLIASPAAQGHACEHLEGAVAAATALRAILRRTASTMGQGRVIADACLSLLRAWPVCPGVSRPVASLLHEVVMRDPDAARALPARASNLVACVLAPWDTVVTAAALRCMIASRMRAAWSVDSAPAGLLMRIVLESHVMGAPLFRPESSSRVVWELMDAFRRLVSREWDPMERDLVAAEILSALRSPEDGAE